MNKQNVRKEQHKCDFADNADGWDRHGHGHGHGNAEMQGERMDVVEQRGDGVAASRGMDIKKE